MLGDPEKIEIFDQGLCPFCEEEIRYLFDRDYELERIYCPDCRREVKVREGYRKLTEGELVGTFFSENDGGCR